MLETMELTMTQTDKQHAVGFWIRFWAGGFEIVERMAAGLRLVQYGMLCPTAIAHPCVGSLARVALSRSGDAKSEFLSVVRQILRDGAHSTLSNPSWASALK